MVLYWLSSVNSAETANRKVVSGRSRSEVWVEIASFPDPAFTKDMGLAHFARNLGLPDLAGEE